MCHPGNIWHPSGGFHMPDVRRMAVADERRGAGRGVERGMGGGMGGGTRGADANGLAPARRLP